MEQLSTTVKFDATEAKEIIDKIVAESDVLQTIKEFHEKHKWQPIETAPKDFSEILLFYPGTEVYDEKTLIGFFDLDFEKWHPYGQHWDGYTRDATHWMPLPEPPKS